MKLEASDHPPDDAGTRGFPLIRAHSSHVRLLRRAPRASLLGIPAVSLPVLSTEGLPLGLQIMGFAGGDAGLFATAAAIRELLVP